MSVMLERITRYFKRLEQKILGKKLAIILTDLGYSRKEVADILQVPESSVRVWLAG